MVPGAKSKRKAKQVAEEAASYEAKKAMTPAQRMKEITARYVTQGARPKTVALGDAPNDAAMLEAADIGVIVANSHGAAMPRLAGEAEGRITRTEKEGPQGWNHAVLAIFQEHGLI